MKCPKCGYLGFETGDKCRNCDYDFSLSLQVDAPAELPLHDTSGAGGPLADLELTVVGNRSAERAHVLDLDRVIGGTATDAEPGESSQHPPPAQVDAVARATTPPAAAPTVRGLPLFTKPPDDGDDEPLISAPRPVRPPLAVRRPTPDLSRGRRTPRPKPREPELTFAAAAPPAPVNEADAASSGADAAAIPALIPASTVSRLLAAVLDLLILAAINGAVIYFTLAITGLDRTELRIIPLVPMAAFLLLLNGGYLIAFTAASGQTIGKMAASTRVVKSDGARVDIAGAVLRTIGCALSLLTAGAGYLPAFISAERRALHDRIAGTRVVKV
jgi:uncharacterized RDD family membrane protein YckC